MNSLLVKNRPEDMSDKDFKEAWENAGYILQALVKTLNSRKSSFDKVKVDDFDCPNHYAKLAYNGGKIEEIEYILSLLPESAK